MTTLTLPLAPPAIRCGHVQTVHLPFDFDPVTARCWRPANPGGELCSWHALLRDVVAGKPTDADDEGLEYLCPTPTSAWFRCRRPLPCTSHDIDNEDVGYARHGHLVTRKVKPPRGARHG